MWGLEDDCLGRVTMAALWRVGRQAGLTPRRWLEEESKETEREWLHSVVMDFLKKLSHMQGEMCGEQESVITGRQTEMRHKELLLRCHHHG